jgi:phage gpG-like protein
MAARDGRGRFLPGQPIPRSAPVKGGDLDIHISWDLSDLDAGLAAVIRRGKDFSPFFRKMQPAVKRHQKKHKGGPDGKWDRHQPSYRKAKRLRKRRGKKVARGTLGKLKRSHRTKVNDFGIEISSPVKWANIHQEGGTAGKGAQIPPRPFLWWEDPFARDVANRALDWAWGVW